MVTLYFSIFSEGKKPDVRHICPFECGKLRFLTLNDVSQHMNIMHQVNIKDRSPNNAEIKTAPKNLQEKPIAISHTDLKEKKSESIITVSDAITVSKNYSKRVKIFRKSALFCGYKAKKCTKLFIFGNHSYTYFSFLFLGNCEY